MGAAWGLRGHPVFATLVCAGSPPDAVGAIRAGWQTLAAPSRVEAEATVSQLDGVLIARYLGPSTARARQLLILAWSLLRPILLDRPPCPSRFWAT